MIKSINLQHVSIYNLELIFVFSVDVMKTSQDDVFSVGTLIYREKHTPLKFNAHSWS